MIAYLRRLLHDKTDARFERFDDVTPILYDDIEWREGVPFHEGDSLVDKAVFYFRAVGNAYGSVMGLVDFAIDEDIHIVDSYLEEFVGPRPKDKMHERLAEHGIPQPRTTAFHGIGHAFENIPNCMFETQFPIVLKFAKGGRRGIGTFLLNNEDDIKRVWRLLRSRSDNGEKGHGNRGNWPFIMQQYIPNSGDYRAVTIGGECIGVVKRGEKPMEQLVMRSSDHGARRYKNGKWPRAVGELAVRAANAMQVDIAGVDVVRHKHTDDLYVIEVNEAPSFTVFERQTEIDVAGEIVSYLRSLCT
jgi:glutathione synthase/RimK-type ligase-like ATP-grasp enzyme